MKGKTGVMNKRLLLAKNSILMLVMLVVIFLAVFAWYYTNKKVEAGDISISAADPDEVEIAFTQFGADSGAIGNYVTNGGVSTWTAGAWGTTANFSGPFKFSNDVTSDGLTFLIPKFISTEDNDSAKADARKNGKIVNVNDVPVHGDDLKTNLNLTAADIENGVNADYVSIPFYLRSRSKDLYIKPSAYLAMKAEVDSADITGTNAARKSAYGNFTSDVLVAAMRVSITGGPVTRIENNVPTQYSEPGESPENESSFTWLPRPDLFLNIPDGYTEDDWSLVRNVKSDTPLSRLEGSTYVEDYTGETFKHNYYQLRYEDPTDPNSVVNGVSLVEDSDEDPTAYKSDVDETVSVGSYSVPTLGEGQKITDFETLSSHAEALSDGYYYYKFYLNIWIEGTDSEARRAMDTGEFKLEMKFGNSPD